MHWMKDRVEAGEALIGVGAMFGSPMIVELIGRTGFDWVWIDYEHGIGGTGDMLHMLQAAAIHKLPAIVRLPGNELRLTKQALDFGAAGIMIPFVNTPEEAAQAVRHTRYAPDGLRGIAQSTRAAQFGLDFDPYRTSANDKVLTVVQIETPEAVENAEAIAAVEGVDVLFVGPLDLSVAMGMPRQFTEVSYEAALDRVVAACHKHGKMPGILAPSEELGHAWMARGYRFIVAAGDGSLLARTLNDLSGRWRDAKKA